MITGFNTDVEHEGVVYHVQTEDKGLKSPLILSLVYVGGTILASKRTPYDDLIASGFDENKLAERLQRQHRLICAAIHTGRIEDLKQQTEREASVRAKQFEQEDVAEAVVAATEQQFELLPPVSPVEEVVTREAAPVEEAAPGEESEPVESEFILGNIADFMPPSVFQSPPAVKNEPVVPEAEEAPPSPSQTEYVDYSRLVDYNGVIEQVEPLQISLLDEKKFVAGEFVKINVHVASGVDGLESAADANVTLKVLGSSFRPLIFSSKTGPDGIATFYAMMPYFTSGRAAILINATVGGHKAELRRVIHQA